MTYKQRRGSIRKQLTVLVVILALILPSIVGTYSLLKFNSFAQTTLKEQLTDTENAMKNNLINWLKANGETPIENLSKAIADIGLTSPNEARNIIMDIAKQMNRPALSQWGNVISSDKYLAEAREMIEQACNQQLLNATQCSKVRKYLDVTTLLRNAMKTVGGNVMLVYMGWQDGFQMRGSLKVSLPGTYDPRVRPWYKAAMKKPGQIVYSPPYIDYITGQVIVTIAKTVSVNGQIVGVVANDLSLQTLVNMGKAYVINKNGKLVGFPIIWSANSVILSYPNKELVGAAYAPNKYNLLANEKYKKKYEEHISQAHLSQEDLTYMEQIWEKISSVRDTAWITGKDKQG